jgi:hypothetical protein
VAFRPCLSTGVAFSDTDLTSIYIDYSNIYAKFIIVFGNFFDVDNPSTTFTTISATIFFAIVRNLTGLQKPVRSVPPESTKRVKHSDTKFFKIL